MSNFTSDEFGRGRQVSVQVESSGGGLARRGILLDCFAFIPFCPALGAFFGGRAMTQSDESKGLAATALALGLLFTVMQIFVGFRVMQYAGTSQNGAELALRDGFTRGPVGLVEHFDDDANASAASAGRFLDELEARYGDFKGMDLVDGGLGAVLAGPGEPRHCTMRFESGMVMGEVDLALDTAIGGNWLSSSLAAIRVRDDENGDLAFPAVQMVRQLDSE